MRGRRHYVDTLELLEPTTAPATNQPTQEITTWASFDPVVTVPASVAPVSNSVAERYGLTTQDRAATASVPRADADALVEGVLAVGAHAMTSSIEYEIIGLDTYPSHYVAILRRTP